MRSPRICTLVLALALFDFSAGVAPAQQTMYGISVSGQLCTINPLTGAGTVLLPGPSVSMTAIGLGFVGGRLYTFDNNIGAFRELNPATGQNVGSPLVISGLGPLAGDGDFCVASNGTGYVVDGGFVPQMYSIDFSTSRATIVTFNPLNPLPSLRGLAADAVDPNKLYGLDGSGNFYYITNVTMGFGNVVPINTTNQLATGGNLAFNFGGLAMTSGNSLFSADNSSFSNFGITLRNSLRQVNPITGALSGPSPIGITNITGITFGPSGAVPLPPPPSGGDGGASGEGSFAGSGRIGDLPGDIPSLAGPFLDTPAGLVAVQPGPSLTSTQLKVFNVSYRQTTQNGQGGPALAAALTISGLLLPALLAGFLFMRKRWC